MLFYDAHNHLQDERFGGRQTEMVAACRAVGVARMVVNGVGATDWPAVADLARAHPDLVIPAFGYHPWHLGGRPANWRQTLENRLDRTPAAVIGEVGLDRWKPDLSYDGQEEVFQWQLQLAAGRNLPLTIHCLRSWGRLLDLLRAGPLPQRGFLLHSYGGPVEMIVPLAALGAFFSFPGYFLHDRKRRQRETFRRVPADRLLVETDAPDQVLPEELTRFPLADGTSARPLNHPANLPAVYAGLASFLGEPVARLGARVAANFQALFGP